MKDQEPKLTFGDSDVLQQKNDGCYWELSRESTEECALDHGLADMLEASGNGLDDFDGVFAFRVLAVANV